MPCAPEHTTTSDAPDNSALQPRENLSPSPSLVTPPIPDKLFQVLERRRTSQQRTSAPEPHSLSPSSSSTVRQSILSNDRRSSHESSQSPVLPLLTQSSASSLSATRRSPSLSGNRYVPRASRNSLPRPPAPAHPDPLPSSHSCDSMGVGSSDCQRVSPVKSPSSESRVVSPGNASKSTTPSRSPSLRSPTTPGIATKQTPKGPRTVLSPSPPPPPPPPQQAVSSSSCPPTVPVVAAPVTASPAPTPNFPGATAATETTRTSRSSPTSASSVPSPTAAVTMDSASPRPVPQTAAASPINVDEKLLPAPMPAPAPSWTFTPPPDNQRTFLFPEDNNLEFSSQFDSGNLILAERRGPYRYVLYTSMDCGNSPRQTNNRQWFHFSVRGGTKGAVLSITLVGMAHSTMFTFDWVPVAAVVPSRPQYTRIPGKATVVDLDLMPETPGYPLLVHKDPVKAVAGADTTSNNNNLDAASDDDNGSGDDDGDESSASPTTTTTGMLPSGGGAKKKKKKKKKKGLAMNLSFEYRLEAENPPEGPYPVGHPLCAATYIASNHPYSYSTLQRNIQTWKANAAGRISAASPVLPSAASPVSPPRSQGAVPVVADVANLSDPASGAPEPSGLTPRNASAIYFHHEVLCKTLEGRDVDLLTITDMHGMQDERMPLISDEDALPVSSASGLTVRPRQFVGKQYVVLTSRVHPGECPGSHMMHGAIEFLMSPKDPRALALRQRFVFLLIPMLNPDGVARGHSRVDADGVDLNRMYQNPTLERHPSPYCVRKLTFPLVESKQLALFIDMHAHANKKGTFFYGNAMPAADQVQNILFAKLVSLNTPYLDFTSCNFSESNMYAVGRGGKGKESSSRIVLFLETGFVHSYVIETSHVCAKSFNRVEPLSSIPGEDMAPTIPSGSILSGSVRHTPESFGDTGKGCLLALLDLKGVNPVSRLPATTYQSTKGATLWLQRQMQVEVAEKLFALAYKLHGRAEPKDASQTPTAAVLLSLAPDEIPDKVAFRSRSLPFCTVQGVAGFVSLDECVSLLAQTPATGLPRSLFGGTGRQRGASNAGSRNDIPVTIAVPKRRTASKSPSSPAGPSGTTAGTTTALPS